MNLVKWDPFAELEEVSSRLNRIFGRTAARDETGRELLKVGDWAPSVDISETGESYMIMAEIAGVKKEDVQVTIEGGMLTIQGERKRENEEKDRKYHRVERFYGSFLRSFHVPEDADENSVKAEFKDGMLNIMLPKSEKAKPKAINISVS